MKVNSPFLNRLHLDKTHFLLSGRAYKLVLDFFNALDFYNQGALDDITFTAFMKTSTNLDNKLIIKIFDLFDTKGSGAIEFGEFYLLVTMLVCIKDNCEKQFVHRHSSTCFELLDEDGSRAISIDEFQIFGRIFNISAKAARKIFDEFDVDGSNELDIGEFKMFTLACIDEQQELDIKALGRKSWMSRCSLL